jgi:endonuclease/exonuclease/phosphatase family metal-dependent hydrolase
MRVMTLNVAHGARRPVPPTLLGPARIGRYLDAIVGTLLDARPDVVALQEIDRASPYTGGLDHFARIQRGSELDYGVHAPHGEDARLGMRHGHALLARRGLADVEERRFARRFCHDKGWVVATVPAPDLGLAVDVASVHLEPFHPRVRRAQVRQLVLALAERRARLGHPLVVMGDMNTGRRGVEALMRGLELTAFAAGTPTFPSRLPLVRLDWILASRELRIAAQTTLAELVSDHAPVVAEIALA